MPDIFDQVSTGGAPAGDIFDQVATGQHVQAHPLKGQNFGDWLSEELLGPVVNAATQLGRGIQGLGHPEQRPLTESVKDVVQGGMQITAPFAAAGLNSEPSPAGPSSAGAPSAVGTALKGGAMGAVKAIPKAAETSILRYTGLPQIARGAYQGAKEALKARAEAGATPTEEAPPPIAPPAPTEDEQLLEAIKRGQANAAAQASVPRTAYTPRPPEYYGVKAAEVPPTNPAPSAPTVSAQPASAAAPAAKVTPIRPETPPESPQITTETPPKQDVAGNAAKSYFAKAKATRYADAISKWAADRGISPATAAEGWEAASSETRGIWMSQMKRKGYLGANETIPNTSAPGIIEALKAKAAQ